MTHTITWKLAFADAALVCLSVMFVVGPLLCIFLGFAAGIVMAVLTGSIVYLAVLPTSGAIFAMIVGAVGSVVVGFPVSVIFHRYQIEGIAYGVLGGLAASVLVLAATQPWNAPDDRWLDASALAIAAYVVIHGAAYGLAFYRILRRIAEGDRLVKQSLFVDAPRGSA